jgi:hypothetical protein
MYSFLSQFLDMLLFMKIKNCLMFIKYIQGIVICLKYLCLLRNHFPLIRMAIFSLFLYSHINTVKNEYFPEHFMFKLNPFFLPKVVGMLWTKKHTLVKYFIDSRVLLWEIFPLECQNNRVT